MFMTPIAPWTTNGPKPSSAALEDFALRREGYLVNARRGNLYP